MCSMPLLSAPRAPFSMHLLIVVVIESVEKGGWARGSILLSTARSIARARRSQGAHCRESRSNLEITTVHFRTTDLLITYLLRSLDLYFVAWPLSVVRLLFDLAALCGNCSRSMEEKRKPGRSPPWRPSHPIPGCHRLPSLFHTMTNT